jgi:hypothetical protein
VLDSAQNNTYLSSGTTYSVGQVNHVAASYAANAIAQSVNAVGPSTSSTTQAIASGMTYLNIGSRFSGTVVPLDGWMQSAEYFNTPLSNSALKELSHP